MSARFVVLFVCLWAAAVASQSLQDADDQEWISKDMRIQERFGIDPHDYHNEFQMLDGVTIQDMDAPGRHTEETDEHGRRLSDYYWKFTDMQPKTIWNDEMVTISYETNAPFWDDWIGAYSPADVDISTAVPVKYGWPSDIDDNYAKGDKTGRGSMKFNMTNLRNDVRFVYVIGGMKSTTMRVMATTVPDGSDVIKNLKFHDNNEQLRPRVVASGDPDEYTVMWSSKSSSSPQLKWATTKEGVDGATPIDATTDQISKDELCGSPATEKGWFDMGKIHSAAMKGMIAQADKDIYYTFGDAATDTWSMIHKSDGTQEKKVWTFRVPPVKGEQPAGRGTTVVWFDDLGRGSNDNAFTWHYYGRASYNTFKNLGHLVSTGKVDAIYHGGDISYAVGYEAVWDFFMDMIAPVASRVLYFTTVGNHESDWPGKTFYDGKDSGGECSVTTIKQLSQGKSATVEKPWWSYDVGLIHMVGTSSEHDFQKDSEQWKWLEADLKAVDRKKTPWIIFGAHRAMYINSEYGPIVDGAFKPSSDGGNMELMVKNMEPLLWKYKVNLGMYGHMHCVQRQSAILEYNVVQKSTNVTDNAGDVWATHVNPQATVHYIVGTGGANLMTATKQGADRPEWNENNIFTWGYALIEAVNAEELTFKWVDSQNNNIMDRMRMTQADPGVSVSNWKCPGPVDQYKNTCGQVYPMTPDKVDKDDDKNEYLPYEISLGVIAGIGIIIFILFNFTPSLLPSTLQPKWYKEELEERGRSSTVEMNGSGKTISTINSAAAGAPPVDAEAGDAGIKNPVHHSDPVVIPKPKNR